MRQQLVRAAIGTAILAGLLSSWATASPRPFVQGQISVILEARYDIEEVSERWGTTILCEVPLARLYLLGADGVTDLEAFAAELSQDAAVESAQPNYFHETPEAVRQMVIGAVGGEWVDYEDQELTERIGLDLAHQRTRGAGVIVAVLDTGVDPEHPAFAGRLIEGVNFVGDNPDPWEERNGVDDDGDGLVDEGYGHGTMVAGLIALVAPDAAILPIRVLDDEGRTDIFRIALGLWAAKARGAHVVNMSFGAPFMVEALEHMIELAAEAGIHVVAAAGNENTENPPYFPGCSEGAFMVSAVDSLDVKADFADYHTDVLVVAPGVGVRSAYPGNEWGIGSGCSFATPLVAGEVALIRSLEPNLTWREVRNRVKAGVDEIEAVPGNEPYFRKLGEGRIYLPRALGDAPSSAPLIARGATRVTVHPNPATGSVMFRLPAEAPRPLGARLSVHDASGRLVAHVALSPEGAAPWATRGPSGEALPSGVYFVRAPGAHRGVPFTIVR